MRYVNAEKKKKLTGVNASFRFAFSSWESVDLLMATEPAKTFRKPRSILPDVKGTPSGCFCRFSDYPEVQTVQTSSGRSSLRMRDDAAGSFSQLRDHPEGVPCARGRMLFGLPSGQKTGKTILMSSQSFSSRFRGQ